jgi:hypothetical protein
MDLNSVDLNSVDLNSVDLNSLPKIIEDNKYAKIYVTMENGNQLCYDRVVRIYISRGNGLAITQISDGGQDLWEVNPGDLIDHLGKLVGVTYNLVIGRYEKFKKIEISINDKVIQRHKYNDSFQCSNIMIN